MSEPKRTEESDVEKALILALFEHWRLADEDAAALLGVATAGCFQEWKKLPEGSPNSVTPSRERIGHLLAIHACLRTLFRNPDHVYGWVHRDNVQFAGAAPLSIMKSDKNGLVSVRQYLESEICR